MTSATITSCQTSSCINVVFYAGTAELVDIGTPVGPPPSTGRLSIAAVGVHCTSGGNGQPFTGCGWTGEGDISHAPTTSNCTLSSTTGWDLTANSTCNISSTWGAHGGAGPGGECVMFGQQINSRSLSTPWGVLDPEVVANSGNRFCIKPLPPATVCSVILPTVIDHGILQPGTAAVKSIDGVVDCGLDPVVSVVGLTEVTMGPGVVTNITPVMVSSTAMRIQSALTVAPSALAGEYSASVIVAVSPY